MTAPLDQQTLSLGAAFVAGVVGSTHCLAMCGGFAGALGMRARQAGATKANIFAHNVATQLGRIASYAIAGAIAAGLVGGIGVALDKLLAWVQIAQILRIVAGALMIAIAIRIVFAWNIFAAIERAGARFWSRLRPLTQRAMSRSHLGASLLLGAAWGWLPCGLVYSMLLYAAFSTTIAQGAAIMMTFGLGTLPAMLTSGLLSGYLARFSKSRATRWVAAGTLASFGALTILAIFPAAHHHH
jgi:uncharacterized protein